jgi:nucleoside-diphosphate-sugar epimerase
VPDAFIIGSTSAIGSATAAALTGAGWTVRVTRRLQPVLIAGAPWSTPVSSRPAGLDSGADLDRLLQVQDFADAVLFAVSMPTGVEAPGFMTGVAGIGDALLRAGLPAEIPSVLSLDGGPRSPTSGS